MIDNLTQKTKKQKQKTLGALYWYSLKEQHIPKGLQSFLYRQGRLKQIVEGIYTSFKNILNATVIHTVHVYVTVHV